MAAGQRNELALQGLQILGGPGARVETSLIAGGPRTHELDIGLGLVDLALHVRQRRPGQGELAIEGDLGMVQAGQSGQGRQVSAGMGQLVEPGVEQLDLDQPGLLVRLRFQGVPPSAFTPTRKSHGSVRKVEIDVSTVVPCSASACDRRAAAPDSQSHSVA